MPLFSHCCLLPIPVSRSQHRGFAVSLARQELSTPCSLSAEALAIAQGNRLAAWNFPNPHSVPLPFHQIWVGNSIHCNSSSGMSLGDMSHLCSIIVSYRKTGQFLSFPPLEKTKTPTAEQTFQHCTSKPGSKIPLVNLLLMSVNLLGLVPVHPIPSACYVMYSALFRSLPTLTPHLAIPVRDTL